MHSIIEPGEAVNLLAGHGAANVMLGIPRLQEIVMTASVKPKTPSMTMTIAPGCNEAAVDKFCKEGSCLMLLQIVDNVMLTECLAVNRDLHSKVFTIKLMFFLEEEYTAKYSMKIRDAPHLVFRRLVNPKEISGGGSRVQGHS
ncbi:hypothetical protein EWM64_g5409 [Hericium alpestre]|uniref:Uncharacterized protein n=1 Tax=Hericium alpestre TaxID=135208 RepID=A0A4Y9ZUQ1_9AGAM|nr:hypothetical protein EWM64_g5409 [Hericium alpestre]